MFCPYCNKEFQSSDNRCPTCGREGVLEVNTPLEGSVHMAPSDVPPVYREFIQNYMGLSVTSLVVAILSCCFTFILIIPPIASIILSILAVSYSGQVDRRTTLGDNEGAKKASKTARTLAWIVIIMNIVLFLIMLLLMVTEAGEGIREMLKGMAESLNQWNFK